MVNERKNRLSVTSSINANAGKIPPQSIDLEETVLGAMMLEKEALLDVADFLKPEAFYVNANQKVYSAILSLNMKNDPIDIMTVTAELRKAGTLEEVGGAYYITNLTNRVASAANIESHARIIQEKFILRELIRTSNDVITSAYDDTLDVFELLSKSEFERDNLLQSVTLKKEVANADLFLKVLTDLDKKNNQGEGITGVPSGFKEIDAITGGWQKSDLIIIAARPGMGKTSFAIQNVINAAFDFGRCGAFFSIEMSMDQLMKKELAIVADVDLYKFRKNLLTDYDWQLIHNASSKINDAKIHWDDTPGITLVELCSKARRLKKRFDIEFLMIDYLQLIKTGVNKNGTREQEIGAISRGLKSLAKELDIPVFALSQLSRAVESRPGIQGKRPMLSDLRESGSIEQDADMVLFLYRPEYYGIMEDEAGESTDGIAEVIIAKHRNGETDDVLTRFNKKTTGFMEANFATEFNHPIVNYSEPKESFKSFAVQPNTDFDSEDYPLF